MGGASASAETEIIRREKRSEDELRDELLEGIPNDVTLIGIAAKLPWRAWQGAASLSPGWRRAFQDGMVYDARVCSQTTETFIVVLLDFSKECGYVKVKKRTLSLFSPNAGIWYKLPPIPGFPAGMPLNIHCQLACLDSSIYLLGGTRSGKDIPSAEVLVLDLAVHPLEWRRCADMQIPRRQFHIGVMHGKIFVFGGEYYPNRVLECSNEAYDPKLDAWSWIAPLIPSGSAHTIYSVGQVYSVGQQFVCRAFPAPNPAELRPQVTDDTPDDYCGKRLFVSAGARGPWLYTTHSDDRFAEDQMDRLHQIIENRFIDNVGRLPWSGETPAECLAPFVKTFEEQRTAVGFDPFLWTYDPLRDDWRVFETESLGTNSVEWALPKNQSQISLRSDRDARLYTWVWTMTF